MEPGADLGPLVTKEAKQRVLRLIETGVTEGASLLLDGRGLVIPGFERGNFVGPTILHNVKVIILLHMERSRDALFLLDTV